MDSYGSLDEKAVKTNMKEIPFEPLNEGEILTDSSIQPYTLSPDEQKNMIRDGGIEIDGKIYYHSHWLATRLKVPEYYLLREFRRHSVHGRIVGKVKIISGESFHKYIESGRLNDYKPRPNRRKRPLEEDINHSLEVLKKLEKS